MEHERYMAAALALAREAAQAGEVPVGCVIVKDGNIIGRGRNRREADASALGHAELLAIAEACRYVGGWRLGDCHLYVTLEPCPMCAGAIINARIPFVYYGAKDSGVGACSSVLNLFEEDFGHKPALRSGILGADCRDLLQQFFATLRQSSKKN